MAKKLQDRNMARKPMVMLKCENEALGTTEIVRKFQY
jgi:hypothetical protein